MSSTITPNMGLVIPTVGSEAGPDYATEINSSLTLIDQHDHSSGYGVQITPAGLNINTDLTFSGNSATSIESLVFTVQASIASLGAVYVKGVDLYYNDTNGNVIQLTASGSPAGGAGTITGLSSGTASAVYSAGVFTFSASTNTPANIQMGSVLLGNNSALSKYLTLAPPNAMAANYTLTLPSTIPASQSFMTLDAAGAMASPAVYPLATAGLASGAVTAAKIASGTITTTEISATAGIVGTQLASGTVDTLQMAPNTPVTASTTLFTNGGNTVLDVTGLTVNFTTAASSPQYLSIRLESASAVSSYIYGLGAIVYIYKDGASIAAFQIGDAVANTVPTIVPPGVISASSLQAAGTTSTYKIRVLPLNTTCKFKDVKISVSRL